MRYQPTSASVAAWRSFTLAPYRMQFQLISSKLTCNGVFLNTRENLARNSSIVPAELHDRDDLVDLTPHLVLTIFFQPLMMVLQKMRVRVFHPKLLSNIAILSDLALAIGDGCERLHDRLMRDLQVT